MSFNVCPLCSDLIEEDYVEGKRADIFHEPELFFSDKKRTYLRCHDCALVFVSPEFHLDLVAEKQEYDLHQNSDTPAYRNFFARLYQPLLIKLNAGDKGLDFGCGPEPVLAKVLQEHGYEVSIYDFFYYPESSVFNACYNFITATEVFEHLYQPRQEFARLWRCLKGGGSLAVMTKLVTDVEAFARWHYKNDPTHVCFFSRETFTWLAKKYSADVEFYGNDVIFLKKQTV